jgi:hypothetical protein
VSIIHAPHGDFSLGFVSLHLFVLREFDCGGLIFRRAAGDLFLNGVAQIDQHLTETMSRLSVGTFNIKRRSISSSQEARVDDD